MKPTPNELAILAHEVARIYGTLEEWIIVRIVKRLLDGAPELPAEVNAWRIEKILASASFKREAIAMMEKVLGDIPLQIDRMLYHTARESVDGGDGATLQEAWERGLIRTMPEPDMAAQTTFMLEKLKEQALDRMNLVNTSMLTSAQQQYIDTLNIAAGFMMSGESPHEAMKTATRRLVREGLTGFYDRAGRRWEPQSAVEMILRTTGNSAANQATFTRMDEVGCDVIVVSAHLGARPKCSLVQGKLFSRSGTTKTVTDKNGAVWQVGDWNKTSYGEPDGILGINCRHHIGMFFDGLSENKQELIDETKNRERYEQEQKQRRLERELRKAKRERDIAKEIGDEDAARRANTKARAKSKELRDHIDKYDLRRSRVRERYHAATKSVTANVPKDTGVADPAYLNKNDPLYHYAKKIKPLEGYYDVVAHSDEFSFVTRDANDNETTISAAEFCEWIKNTPSYNGGPIRLIACRAGAENGVTAQAVADILQVEVLAPNKTVYVYFDGQLLVADELTDEQGNKLGRPDTERKGEWRIFRPRRK